VSRNEEPSRPPTVDDRTPSELHDELVALADQYVDDWNPDTADMADELLAVGAEFGYEVSKRLNRLPEKHRAGFLETLGKGPQPPQAARLPLSVDPASDIDRNVQIPTGTQVTATTRDDEKTVFEIPSEWGFEATPASLTDVYAVDPTRDRITSHDALADGDRQQLFVGHNRQQHALYLGDESLFEVDSGAVLEIKLEGHVVDGFDEHVVWEYYGTPPGQTDGDDEPDNEADTETDGWHRLPTVDTTDESLRSRLDRLPEAGDDDSWSTRRQLPGEFVERGVDGTDSRWLRCRVVEPTAAVFGTEIEMLSVTTSAPRDRERSTPDGAFVDDVPLAVEAEGDIEPLGQFPQPSSTLYLAADEALTKPGAQVQVSFEPPGEPREPQKPTDSTDETQTAEFGALDEPPVLSWEYWDGSGWSGLAVDDGTTDLQAAGDLIFVVPDDVESTAVSGQEAHWIRARLVAGSYGDLGATLTGERNAAPDRPRFSTITVDYDHAGSTVDQLVAENNGQFEPWSTDDGRPFEPLAATAQTIYFGFDGPLREGPIPLFVPVEETGYPTGFDPGVQWEYCVDPEADSWSRLAATDGTNSLTERGVVSLAFSEPTQATERFGTNRHWIRAVITGDQFDPAAGRPTSNGQQSSDTQQRVDATRQPPAIEGVYPNTQWADNARTVENEILGSSDGSANQQFTCAHGPLLDCELWVDESSALSRADQRELQNSDPDRIQVVTDDRGEQTAVWVRWQAVDRLGEGETRAYRLDRTDGTIQFGDGDRGKIPPQGIDSIRATYRTGGGPAGNVTAGAVETLKTPISLVESVDNPFAGAGGSPIEPTPAVADRTAGEIRSRGQAVTPQDYEAIAANTVRTLARVDCQPNRGPDGDRTPGWVRVVVVPESGRERPKPSLAVETRLEETLAEAAPARLTSGRESKLSVGGPQYSPCDITATVAVDHSGSRSQRKTEIAEALAAFLHPLDGNNGDGWAFGESPTVEAISRRLQQVPAVTDVRALSATLRVDGERQRLGTTPNPPALPADGLVCNGSHRLTLEVDDES